MALESVMALALFAGLAAYVLRGGADLGAGVLHLLARGPRAEAQRALIAETMGPLWEANHVWLILVAVLLFTAFPPAFAAIMTALHVPVMLMLFALVLRGAAFAFGHSSPGVPPGPAYGRDAHTTERGPRQRWDAVFGLASAAALLMQGLCLGALLRGDISAPQAAGARELTEPRLYAAYVAPWLAPLPLACAVLALALCALLAATSLAARAPEDRDLREDFGKRGLAAALVSLLAALATLGLSASDAPRAWENLWSRPLAVLLVLGGGITFLSVLLALVRGAYRAARTGTVISTVLLLSAAGVAQYPCLAGPDITLHSAAAPQATLKCLALALVVAVVVVIPAFRMLHRVFGGRATAP